MAKKNPAKPVKDLDQVVERWVKLRREIDRRKHELEELEPPIKDALKRAPDRQMQFGPHMLALTADSTRNIFDTKKAIEILGEKTLSPFVRTITVEGHIRMK